MPSASFTLYPQAIAPVLNGEPAVPLLVDRRYLQYPLSLNIEVAGGHATLIVERAHDIPDVDLPGMFWGIMRQVAGDPDVPPSAIAWAEAQESASRLPQVRTFEPAHTLVDEFAHAVRRCGDATVIECDGKKINYRQLDADSDGIAAQIAAGFPMISDSSGCRWNRRSGWSRCCSAS